MRIYAFHDESGCGWYRIRLPLGEVAKHGHEVRMVLGSKAVPSEMARWPVVVGQRIDKRDALPQWRRIALTSKLVYEIDDDVFNVHITNWAAFGVYGRADIQDAVSHAAEVAHLVTVTNDRLADVMRCHNPNVAVLPNCVPGALLEHERPRRDKVVVGWAGGASHALDIAMIAPQVGRFLDRTPRAELHLIGTDYRPTIGRIARYTGWDTDPWRYYRNVDFDIGLAPLVSTTFSASKSAIKALEYAALGIPVIASDEPPYRDFVVDGVTGYLVRRKSDWGRRLDELATDRELREDMGRKARQHAESWTIENNWQRWVDAYGSLLR